MRARRSRCARRGTGIETEWDRWVLTFSLSDQVTMVQGAAEAAAHSLPALERAIPAGVLVVALVLLVRLRRTRRREPIAIAKGAPRITRALRRVVASAARRGVPVGPGTTARGFARLASAAFPAAAEPLAWLVGEHERCRYAGAPAAPTEPAAPGRPLGGAGDGDTLTSAVKGRR